MPAKTPPETTKAAIETGVKKTKLRGGPSERPSTRP
jgi:hypothetical protein